MTDTAFRFGIVAAQADSSARWVALARHVEELGYQTLLVPDTLQTLAPAVACAVAATATSTLRVGPYVLSAPNRTAGQVAVETATLHTLTDGRYELGVGAGRPGSETDAAALGMPYGSPGQRITQVKQVVAATRDRSPATRVLVAASGPRMLAVAGEIADTVALGLAPAADDAELGRAVDQVRGGAGGRPDQPELCLNLLCVGDDAPPWLSQYLPADIPALIAGGSVSVLTGSLPEMVETLQRRRTEFGVSYICTNAAFADALAPVVEQLADR